MFMIVLNRKEIFIATFSFDSLYKNIILDGLFVLLLLMLSNYLNFGQRLQCVIDICF